MYLKHDCCMTHACMCAALLCADRGLFVRALAQSGQDSGVYSNDRGQRRAARSPRCAYGQLDQS
jgi:hypothetical protein